MWMECLNNIPNLLFYIHLHEAFDIRNMFTVYNNNTDSRMTQGVISDIFLFMLYQKRKSLECQDIVSIQVFIGTIFHIVPFYRVQ